MILIKNKKEKFTQLSTENLQAIKNLGDFASNLQSGGTSGEYLFPGTTLNLNTANSKIKVNSIEIGGVTVDKSYLNKIQSDIKDKLSKSGGEIKGNLIINSSSSSTPELTIKAKNQVKGKYMHVETKSKSKTFKLVVI